MSAADDENRTQLRIDRPSIRPQRAPKLPYTRHAKQPVQKGELNPEAVG